MKTVFTLLLTAIFFSFSSFETKTLSIEAKTFYNPTSVTFIRDGYTFYVMYEQDGSAPTNVPIYYLEVKNSSGVTITPTENLLFVHKPSSNTFYLKGTLRIPGKNFYFSTTPQLLLPISEL